MGVGVLVSNHGNAWNAQAVGIGGFSNIIDTSLAPYVTIFGHVTTATTINIFFSSDGVNFYQATNTINALANSDFSIDSLTTGMRYLQLKSSAATTITATVAGKP